MNKNKSDMTIFKKLTSDVERGDKVAFEPLWKKLPLPVPMTMMIDPSNTCNFRCIFCPTGDHELLSSVQRPKGIMEYELFCKIIDDIKKMVKCRGQKLRALSLHKDGEPFINKRLGDMIAYARRSDVAEVVDTTSNGSLITKDRAVEIIQSGLDLIRISIEQVSDKAYKEVTVTYSNYNKIRNNIKVLFEERNNRNANLRIHVKIIDINLSHNDKMKFLNDFSSICDTISINALHGWCLPELKDFALGLDLTKANDGVTLLQDRKACPSPFKRLVVNFNGEVSVCCVDWAHGTIVGDLRKQNLIEVWEGDKLREFRLLHLRGLRSMIKACAECQYCLGYPNPSDLDDNLDYLIEKYRANQLVNESA